MPPPSGHCGPGVPSLISESNWAGHSKWTQWKTCSGTGERHRETGIVGERVRHRAGRGEKVMEGDRGRDRQHRMREGKIGRVQN